MNNKFVLIVNVKVVLSRDVSIHPDAEIALSVSPGCINHGRRDTYYLNLLVSERYSIVDD